MTDKAKIEQQFINAALKRSQLLASGSIKQANREYDRFHRLKTKMRTFPDKGKNALERIAKTDDADVRIMAAAALLAVDEQQATEILEQIASQGGVSAFTAEMTIREWKQGSIKDFWD